MRSCVRSLWVIVSVCCVIPLLAGEAATAKSKVTIEMVNGDKLEGTVLKRDEKFIYMYVGGMVVKIDQKQLKNISDTSGGKVGVGNAKKFKLYSTGDLPVRNVQAHVETLGQAIVVVKTPSGLGTGWFCNKDGYLITNNHVVAGEKSITVTLFHKKGKGFGKKVFKKVRIIALNDDIDLALLKIEEKIDVPYPLLYIGDSTKAKVGDKVFAIGNPMGLERSTSEGIVSKAARNAGGRLYLQVTAPIAPGNSGGPLFNERGEVIGVVNMGFIFLDGLGFAIPSKYVKEFLDNVEAFSYDEDNPNSGTKYMEAPATATDDSFKLLSSDYVKTGHGVCCLRLVDLDADGLKEVVFVNNSKSEIGILRYKKQAEKAEEALDYEDINTLKDSVYFKLDTITVSSSITSLAIDDINGDNLPDIVFVGDVDGLAVLEQKKDNSFKPARTIDRIKAAKRLSALKIRDLDGDGKKDLFVLGMDRFSIFWGGKKRAEFPLGGQYKSSIKNYFFIDANNDKLLDIVFFSVSKHYASFVRLQNQEHQFVQDMPLRSHLSGVVRQYANGGADSFLTLDTGLNRIRHLQLTGEGDSGLISIPVDPESGITAQVDFINQNGKQGLLAADRAKSQFVFYSWEKAGISLTRSPAPAELITCKAFASNGKSAVVSLSRKDRIFGISTVTDGTISFPRPINTIGDVEFIKIETWPGEAGTRLLWIEKIGEKYMLHWIPTSTLVEKAYDKGEGSIDIKANTFSFISEKDKKSPSLPKKPTNIAVADFNDDAHPDIVVYWSYSGKESLYLGTSPTEFKEVISERKFLEEQKDQPLIVADVAGKKSVLLVQPGFVRVMKVDKLGKLFVHRQFNWSFGKISYLTLYDNSKELPRFLAIAGTQAHIVELDAAKSDFRQVRQIDLTGLDVGALKVGDVDGDNKNDIVILGKGTVNLLMSAEGKHGIASSVAFNAKLDVFRYWNLHTADMNGDGKDEVLLFDSQKAMFEVYRAGKDKKLKIIFRHRLFEKTIFQRNNSLSLQLPQELVVGDVDGDGKPDFICILQDRVALYMQGKK